MHTPDRFSDLLERLTASRGCGPVTNGASLGNLHRDGPVYVSTYDVYCALVTTRNSIGRRAGSTPSPIFRTASSRPCWAWLS